VLGVRLGELPLKARWLITLLLVSYLLNHAWAFLLIKEIQGVEPSIKDYFSYKTTVSLLRMAHQHSFGHGTMFFLTGGLALFTTLPDALLIALITAAFAGAWLEHLTWFMLKGGSAAWERVLPVAGTLYAGAFVVMTARVLWELWAPRRRSEV
jgi:hypothetical protein